MDAALRDVNEAVERWLDAGRSVVLATVVSSSGSAPRGIGARLAIAGPGEWIGALSGGCTEAAVIAEAERLLAEGDPDSAVLVSYTKETLADVGPVCGATLGVIVECVDDVLAGTLERVADTAMAGTAAEYVATYSWASDERVGEELQAGAAIPLIRESATMNDLEDPSAHSAELDFEGDALTFTQHVDAAQHVVLGGAGDIARELVLLADRLAWRTTLIDARRTVLEQTLRACQPTDHHAEWAESAWDELGVDERTACVALAHEAHHDEPFLARALESDAAYVGAVGSRRVQAQRREALAERGLDQAKIERLRGPAGLDIGGGAAAEIALAIAGEIIALANERDGTALSAGSGPIHAR